jgi:hypothetical protein
MTTLIIVAIVCFMAGGTIGALGVAVVNMANNRNPRFYGGDG